MASPVLQSSLDDARAFVAPVLLHSSLPATTSPVTSLLAERTCGDDSIEHRREVILEACGLVERIGRALAAESAAKSHQVADTGVMTYLFPLLDLILLEGVYPELSSGVGFPTERQRRSTLCNRACMEFDNLRALDSVLPVLNSWTFDPASALHKQLQDTILLDVIAANAEIAYSPSRPAHTRRDASEKLGQYLRNVQTSRLQQTLTVLIKASAPSWLRDGLSHHLSLLAIRPRGVRQTIEFLASYYDLRLPSDIQAPSGSAKGRPLHPEALSQASKVLTSVPSSMTTEEYYNQIAPQLLELLDGKAGPELAHAAGKIIANGVLSKRDVGAPGKVGWLSFVQPQLNAIKPLSEQLPMTNTSSVSVQNIIIVGESTLETALRRLVTILQATINVALTGRVLRPLLICLWGIVAYDESTLGSRSASTLARELCETFLQRCGSLDHLHMIRNNLSWIGEEKWILGPGEMAGIAIRLRGGEDLLPSNSMETIGRIHGRLELLVDLIAASQMNEIVVDDFFLDSLKSLLHGLNTGASNGTPALLNTEDDAVEQLTSIYLVQALLTRFGQKLATRPKQILKLIDQILVEGIDNHKSHLKRDKSGLEMLSSVTESAATEPRSDTTQDMIVTATSVVNAIISAPSYNADHDMTLSMQSIADHLRLIQMSFESLETDARSAITSAMDAIHRSSVSGEPVEVTSTVDDPLTRLAQAFLTDEPSTQARLLNEILPNIRNRKIPMDVPALTTLLLDQVRMNQDTYIHPYVNEALAQLAAYRSPGYVTRTTSAAFRDADEQTDLDGRLRIGETLTRLVETLSHASSLAGDMTILMAALVETCLMVAGRRSTRSLEHGQRTQVEKQARLEQRKAERAWGGELPDLSTTEQDDRDDSKEYSSTQRLQDHASIEKIIRGWEGSDKTEDVRVRTSALSVLSTVLEMSGPALTASNVADAIDLSLAILSVEQGDEGIILRRAAVFVLMAHLQALDAGLESKRIVPGLDTAKWLAVQERLKTVAQTDSDDLVRENASAVLESLEALRMKQLLHGQHASTELGTHVSGLTQLRGLVVQPLKEQQSKIEILE